MSQLAYMESVSAESVLLLIILQYHLGQGPFVLMEVFLFRSSKSHPGPVVHISDNPMDEGKVGYFKDSSIHYFQSKTFLKHRYHYCLRKD